MQIVHFNRLKLCSLHKYAHGNQAPTPSTSCQDLSKIGEHIEFDLSDDDTSPSLSHCRRYPVRVRQPPDRLIDHMHL